MPSYKEMDPDEVRRLLEGQENVLSSEALKEETFFRHVSCPTCRSTSNEAFINPHRPFAPGVALPLKLLRCLTCRTEFDPYSGFVTRAPADLLTRERG